MSAGLCTSGVPGTTGPRNKMYGAFMSHIAGFYTLLAVIN